MEKDGSPSNYSHNDMVDEMRTEIRRLSSENEELEKRIDIMNAYCSTLQAHIRRISEGIGEKREGSYEHQGFIIRGLESRQALVRKTTKVVVRTDEPNGCTSLIVKDGYQWRKYGQKITKDNPFPRAYFRCAKAPDCPVKKKVQKCMDNEKLLVATYDGEHNHGLPGVMDDRSLQISPFPAQHYITSVPPNISFDLTKVDKTKNKPSSNTSNSSWTRYEEYVGLMENDPSLKADVAGALARTMLGNHWPNTASR